MNTLIYICIYTEREREREEGRREMKKGKIETGINVCKSTNEYKN